MAEGVESAGVWADMAKLEIQHIQSRFVNNDSSVSLFSIWFISNRC